MPIPVFTASRMLAMIATALATARDDVRQLLSPDGALSRALLHVVQVAMSLYDIAAMTFWAAALWAAARLSGTSWPRSLFALVIAVSAALPVVQRTG